MRSLRLLSAVFFVIEVSLPTAAEGFDCGKGENIYGSVEDGKFNLRCEPPENATHFKAIKCPPGTVFDAAQKDGPNVWALRCISTKNNRGEWHGPYLEWFIYENQMQHMWSGAYESDKPVGTWVKEDAKGKIIEKGKMRHSPASVGYREQDGDWLRWSEQEGKLIPAGRFYLGETLDAYKKRMKSKRNQKPGS